MTTGSSLRLTLPGGRITAAQLRQAAKAALEKGCGFADLSTRRQLCLPGLAPEDRAEWLPLFDLSEPPPDPAAGCPLSSADPMDSFDSGVREQKEPDLFTLAVPVLAGRLEPDQMKKAADLAERYAGGALQLTSRQNLLFTDVPRERVAQILEGLESVNLSAKASLVARALVICPGGEWNGPGEREITRLGKEWIAHLEKRVPMDRPFTIHVSGGPEGCPHPEAAEIGLPCGSDGCRIWVGGRALVENVSWTEVPLRLERLLVGYKRLREPAEALMSFFRRMNEQALVQLVSENES